MHVRYVGWKETIAESHFEDNRRAENKGRFRVRFALISFEIPGFKIKSKLKSLIYNPDYASADN